MSEEWNTAVPKRVFNEHKTVTNPGTAEALGADQPIRSVVIKALKSNTGIIYVGNEDVDSTNGLELESGESVPFDIDNLNKFWLDVEAGHGGEGVSYAAVL